MVSMIEASAMPSELTSQILHLVFYVITLVFLFHSVVLGFHWFAYSTNKRTPMVALATYLIGSAVCFMVMAGTLSLM